MLGWCEVGVCRKGQARTAWRAGMVLLWNCSMNVQMCTAARFLDLAEQRPEIHATSPPY